MDDIRNMKSREELRQEILDLKEKGHSNSEIGLILGLAESTVHSLLVNP